MELVLAITIIALLSVTTVVSVSNTVNKMKFQNVFNQVEQMVFDARSMAVSGKQIVDCNDADHDLSKDDSVVAAGYGLNVTIPPTIPPNPPTTPPTFILFSDAHNYATGSYVVGGDACGDVKEKEYALPTGYSVTLTPSASKANFAYIPPDAAFKSDLTCPTGCAIEIKNNKYSQTITIDVSGIPGRKAIINYNE